MKTLVVAHPDDPLAYFIATGFCRSLISLGHRSDIKPWYETGYDLCLVMYAHVFYNFPKDNTIKIAYNWETLRIEKWRRLIHRALGQFNYILEGSKDNLNIHLPIQRLWCPIGYDTSFELTPVSGEKYQAALIGYAPKGSYRRQIINSVERKGFRVWYVEDFNKSVHDEGLSRILHNTAVHLNIHRTPKFTMFESVRVVGMLLSNRAFVISEPSSDGFLVSGKHYVETDNFPRSVKYYLAHSEKRSRIAQEGYDYVRTNCRLEDYISACLEKIK